jgi:hypothetical protein
MEIIIALLVIGFGIWWVFIRDNKEPEIAAPYKVEAPVQPEVEKPADVVVEAKAPAIDTVKPAVITAKPKAAAKPKAQPKTTTTAKPKDPVKPKTAAKPKATRAKPQV